MSQEKQVPPEQPTFLTKKEFDEWVAKQQESGDGHEAEPDENYVPAWAKTLTEKVDGLTNSSKTKNPPANEQQSQQSQNNAPPTKLEPPPPVVEPKKGFWPKGWPTIL